MAEMLSAWSIERICKTDQSVIRDGFEYLASRFKLLVVEFESFDSFICCSFTDSVCFRLLFSFFVKIASILPIFYYL